MPIQITIIGLGQVGTSIGLALAKIKDQAVRVGNDRDPGVTRRAEKLGAIDRSSINLPSAVRDADLVILALPVDEIRETLEIIAQDLKPGSVLIDTSPVKNSVMAWAKELLPGEDRFFVALTPSLNPAYLMEPDAGPESAHADLFQKSLFLITSLPGVDESAITLAANLVQILGATSLFADNEEADGLLSYSHLLPQLVSAALVNATTNQTGWREARKLAGQHYASATEPALHPDETTELGQAAMLNAENAVRMLDQMLIELRDLRDEIADGNAEALKKRLEHARTNRELWWKERLAAEWEKSPTRDVRMPTGGEMIGKLFVGMRPKKDRK
jgi:prephenate dehydrogenase